MFSLNYRCNHFFTSRYNIFIPTTNEDGVVSWEEVTAVTRHDPGEKLYEIKTLGGREVIVTENNCIDTVIKNINIYPRLEYYVPNSFTPNNDRLNDEFEIKCNGAKEIEITIFNRWGEKIFYKKSNTNIAWTGDNQASGIYLYKLRIVDFKDSITNKIGELLLIK